MFLNISIINDFAYNQTLTISGDGAGNQEVNGGDRTSWNTVQESATKYFSFTEPSNNTSYLKFGPNTGIIVNLENYNYSGNPWIFLDINGGGNAIYQISDDTDYVLVTPEDYTSLDSGGNINLRFYPNEPAISDDGSYPEPPTDEGQPNDVIE